jgi:uncharacterized protein YjbI with pentapeptide repeats
VRNEKRTVGRKKLVRKAESPSKRGIVWPRWTGFRGMTVRDWLELLVVPLALIGIGLLFDMQQADRQQVTEKHQLALAEQRTQDEALQAYLDEGSRLLLEKDLSDPKVQTILRARTITVLGRLDPSEGMRNPSGKTALMQFLVEADLVQRVEGRAPIISLHGADLRKAYLFGADLHGTDLRNTDLTDANLSTADLSDANLHRANLTDAHLSDANLTDAHLTDASGITNEELEQQADSLEGATMPNGQKYEDWRKDQEGRKEAEDNE